MIDVYCLMPLRGQFGLQFLYPLDDVTKHFFGDGFFDLSIFGGMTCGAMLEEVVQGFVLLDDVALVLWQSAT